MTKSMLYDNSLHTAAKIDLPGLIENRFSNYPCDSDVLITLEYGIVSSVSIDAVNDWLGPQVGVPGQTRLQHPSVANYAGIMPTDVRRWNCVHNAALWFSPARGATTI
jgi:hypothetical protein